MKKIELQMRETPTAVEITCDKCGKVQQDLTLYGTQGWWCFQDTGGYASPFGDMVNWSLDLCEDCFYNMVKDYIKYEEEP